MRATSPQQLYVVLEDAFNAADLARLMTLYETNTVLVAQPGQVITGTESIRGALQGFLDLNGRITVQIKEVVQSGDLALACTTWSVSGSGADGQPVTLGGISTDVLRRQADGDWRYAIDQPWGDQMTAP